MGGHVDHQYVWTEVGESSITGPNLIRDTSKKVGMIQKRLLTAQSRQNSYVDIRRLTLEFKAGDYVFLKEMPKRGSDQVRKTREAVAEVHWTLRGTREGWRGYVSVSIAAEFVERS